ncbi:hypothetical protein [Aureivirga sp. CE67]|uniref:hypothetical protein n=1 Tax=Aureivirga sp. CE67 TaxID=1788983 RepID=UPI0018CA33C2|nr:hypothetical protein [Aureivirga sp. CE67]
MGKLKIFSVMAIFALTLASCGAQKQSCTKECKEEHKEKRCDHSKKVEIKEVETSSSEDNK